MRRLTFLGTGDPLNEERAQTSLARALADGATLLLDTGSGSTLPRQLTEARIPLATIRHVVISHAHFDHPGGLAPLLVARAALPEARVTVHAAAPIGHALRDALAIVSPGIEAWLGPRLDWHPLPLGVPVALADLTLTPPSRSSTASPRPASPLPNRAIRSPSAPTPAPATRSTRPRTVPTSRSTKPTASTSAPRAPTTSATPPPPPPDVPRARATSPA